MGRGEISLQHDTLVVYKRMSREACMGLTSILFVDRKGIGIEHGSELVAWAMEDWGGGIGMVFVKEFARGRGLGKWATSLLADRLSSQVCGQ